MSTQPSDEEHPVAPGGQTRLFPRRSFVGAPTSSTTAGEHAPRLPADSSVTGLRFDRQQTSPPRPHLALTAHRVWTEILNSAIDDDADTSVIHDLANLHPNVSAAILRAANAAQGGVVRPVQDVGLAIEMLGLRRLRLLAKEQQGRTAQPAVINASA